MVVISAASTINVPLLVPITVLASTLKIWELSRKQSRGVLPPLFTRSVEMVRKGRFRQRCRQDQSGCRLGCGYAGSHCLFQYIYVYTVSAEKMCEGHAVADAGAEMSQMGRRVRVVPLFIGYTGGVVVF